MSSVVSSVVSAAVRIQNARLAAAALAIVALGSLFGCTNKVDDKDTTLNTVIRANVKGLDPINANDLYSAIAIEPIHEGLLQYDFLKRPYELIPLLAESMPTVTDGGLTYTFKIKPGVRFQDDPCFKDGKGRELVAEDFVYSWKRLEDPANVSEGGWIFEGKIKGLAEWVAAAKAGKANYDAPIEGFQTPDPHTIVIKLIQPYYQLNFVLAHTFSTVVAKEAVAKYGKEIINHPVGTGPYRLESWVRNSKLTYVRNPNWRGEKYPSEGSPADKEAGLLEDAGKPIPFADKMVLTELIEDSPRWQNFEKGNFDFAEIPADAFENAVKDKKPAPRLAEKGVQLQIQAGADITYSAFNMKDPVLGQNLHLRRAIALAQDNVTFIKNFYNNRATLAQSPIPPDFASYDPNFKNPWQTHDLEKAKAELKAAGFPNGENAPTLTYESLSDSKARQQAEFFAQSVAPLGLKVTINSNTWPQFQEKIKQQRAQIFGIAWLADYPDAQNFFQLFWSKNMSPGPNDSSFSNAEFDKLYVKSLTMGPSPERDEIYHKLRDIVVDQSPWLFIAHREMYREYHGWLHNFKPNEISQRWFKYLRVDPKQRAQLKPKL